MNAFARLGATALAVFGLSSCTSRGVQTPGDVVGQPMQDAVSRFGAPSSDGVMTLRSDTLLLEFQNGLYPAVLDTLADGASVDVRQVRWSGNPERAVWAVQRDGEWVVVDALEWDADVQF